MPLLRNRKENERCISMLEGLDREADGKVGKLSAAEQRLAELVTVLIEDFEEKAYALKPARRSRSCANWRLTAHTRQRRA